MLRFSTVRSLIFVCIALFAVGVIGFAVLNTFFPLPSLKPYSLVIEDREGTFLHAFLADDGVWRLRTSPDEIPDRLKKILIEKEDRYFYYHPGVNPFSIGRAIAQNFAAGKRVSGASTITMQIARMLEPKQRTYSAKLAEVFRALQLELRYSKDELLEIYLSMVPLGGNIEGLKSASLIYYQTPLERLNIAQLFDLILIPNNPNRLQPDREPERLYGERTRKALEWVRRGYFTREDSATIWTTNASATRHQLPRLAPHFSLRLKAMQNVASRNEEPETEIQSSLSLKTQRTVETLLANHMRPWKQKAVQNGAVVVIENSTREITAYAGSDDFSEVISSGQVDAAKALRSPGSTLKPFLYAHEMDRGILTPRSRLYDTPYDAEGFWAENYDGRYSGLVYADEALRRSLNVPMVRLLHDVGAAPFVDYLAGIGFSSLQIQKPKLGLSMILGGCGVTLEELVAAYATFPSGGVYLPASFVHRREDELPTGKQVFAPASAFMVTEILADLDRPDLPNNFESSVNLPRVAFKTGTSYGRRDAWAIGYTAEYTVGVWVGNVTYKGNPDLVGSQAAAPLLIDILNSISRKHQKSILPIPRDVSMRLVCAHSGQVPTRECEHVVEDFYSVSRTLTRMCNVDREFMVSPDGRISFCPSCISDNRYKLVRFTDYAPELLTFWNVAGKKFASVPPHNPACARVFSGDGPRIMSPSQDMTYYFVSKEQQMTLQASSEMDVKEHVWYLDDGFLGRRKAGEKLFLSLHDGEHTIACVDDKGRMSSVKIKVKHVL